MPLTTSAASAHYLRSRMSRVCVAITGDTLGEMLAKADAVVRENAFLEFRLDYLDKPLSAMAKLRDFLYERSELTAIATCRRTAGGGRFKGSAVIQLEVLTLAIEAGFQLIDLEIESAQALNKTQLTTLRGTLAEKGAGLIISSHDFQATRDLDKTFSRIQAFHPDFIKIVSTAKSLTDNVEMMRFLERQSEGAHLIGICMGDQGLVSRVLGVRSGSIFTFAAASEGEETGPGQIAARTLLETYRIDQVEPSTRVYGVAGNPIRHSLSPVMMNTAFRRETVNAVFLALQTKKISDLLKLVRELPVHGLSVTMPLKQEIMQYLEKTDALSTKIGACNTVVRSQDGRLFGFNTDVGGIVRPLERRMPLRGAHVLVLGAGGAARAAVFGLVEKGAEVVILNRTPETAQKLARQARAKTIRRDQVAKTQFDIILNATPAGMVGQKVTTILEPHEINARIVFDTVYSPLETPLIRTAREKGIAVITGVEMFVQQGARQFEIWTGKPAPEEEMMRVVVHALRKRAELDQQVAIEPGRLVPVLVTSQAKGAVVVAESAEPAKESLAPVVRRSAAAPAIVAKAKPAVPQKAVKSGIEKNPGGHAVRNSSAKNGVSKNGAGKAGAGKKPAIVQTSRAGKSAVDSSKRSTVSAAARKPASQKTAQRGKR